MDAQTGQLFASAHPRLLGQPATEAAVIDRALAMLRALRRPSSVVGDRGLGRKERLIAPANRTREFVSRISPDSTAPSSRGLVAVLLAELLERQPWPGEVIGDGGEAGPRRCRVRAVQATLRFSRTGRRADSTEAILNLVEPVPLAGGRESLGLATTLPTRTPAECRGVARVYAYRWAIETAFETLKAWGLERFMVRAWRAIDRLLRIVALAYALVVLALQDPRLAPLHAHAIALLRQWTVLGRRLTPGKLAEAIGLDYSAHRRAWTAVWLH